MGVLRLCFSTPFPLLKGQREPGREEGVPNRLLAENPPTALDFNEGNRVIFSQALSSWTSVIAAPPLPLSHSCLPPASLHAHNPAQLCSTEPLRAVCSQDMHGKGSTGLSFSWQPSVRQLTAQGQFGCGQVLQSSHREFCSLKSNLCS